MDPEEEKENKNQKQQAIGKVLFWIYSLNMDNRGGGRAETEIWGEKKKRYSELCLPPLEVVKILNNLGISSQLCNQESTFLSKMNHAAIMTTELQALVGIWR